MWKKNILWTILGAFLFAFPVFAYDLTLTKIGTLSTIGADYTLVSYTGSVPQLEGTATPAAMVSVKVNATSSAVIAATTSGVWNFTPSSLNTGDNLITVNSGSQILTFTIRFNASAATPTPTPTATASAVTTLPETGVWENILYGVLAGIAVMGFGVWVKKRMRIWENGR